MMNLTNSQRKKSSQLLDRKTQLHFNQIKSRIAAYNMSNVHVPADVLSTLLLSQQGNLYNLQQKIMHGISKSSRPEVLCKKAALKTSQNLQRHTCVGVSF